MVLDCCNSEMSYHITEWLVSIFSVDSKLLGFEVRLPSMKTGLEHGIYMITL